MQGVFDGAISNRLKAMAPTTAIDEVRKVSSLHSASSCCQYQRSFPEQALNSGCTLQVCLAFESMDVGQQMLAWATKFCLFPDDEVYIVHCLSKVTVSVLRLLILPVVIARETCYI